MVTPNYSYEKRQRELAKKRKQEEKRQRKLHRDTTGEAGAPAESGKEGAPIAPPPTDEAAQH